MIREDIASDRSTSTSEGSIRKLSVYPSSTVRSHRALRAHHLPHNRFIRPARYLQVDSEDATQALNGFNVKGGFDGSKIFVHIEVDVSKTDDESVDKLIQAPLGVLNEVDTISDLFPGNNSSSPIDNLVLDWDVSSSVHLGILVGFEVTGLDFKEILFRREDPPSGADIADRSFLQLDDISAKFEASAGLSGSLDIAGAALIDIDDGCLSLTLGLGLEESSEKIYFRNITSSLAAMRQSGKWRKVGILDAFMPVSVSALSDDSLSAGFRDVLNTLPNLKTILSVSDGDLFDSDLPEVSIDFDVL